MQNYVKNLWIKSNRIGDIVTSSQSTVTHYNRKSAWVSNVIGDRISFYSVRLCLFRSLLVCRNAIFISYCWLNLVELMDWVRGAQNVLSHGKCCYNVTQNRQREVINRKWKTDYYWFLMKMRIFRSFSTLVESQWEIERVWEIDRQKETKLRLM